MQLMFSRKSAKPAWRFEVEMRTDSHPHQSIRAKHLDSLHTATAAHRIAINPHTVNPIEQRLSKPNLTQIPQIWYVSAVRRGSAAPEEHTTADDARIGPRSMKIPRKYGQNPLTRVCAQVLAVDLLNPTPQAEARKHKLKVRHQT